MSPQGRYWFLTWSCWECSEQPRLGGLCVWIKGQKEETENGYMHWQFVASFSRKVRRKHVTDLWPGVHAELTISQSGSEAYVFKEDTKVGGSEFEVGTKTFNPSVAVDWDSIWDLAKSGRIEEIPTQVRIRHYGTLKRIAADYAKPVDMVRNVKVYWGPTATGKSYNARKEAGAYYIKNPNTKWWCGYRGERSVVIDEFRGRIDPSYFLLWLDRYKCVVETKFGSTPLCATDIWICSNLDPRKWWPELDDASRDAILRRMEITHFQNPFSLPLSIQ